MWYLYQLQIHRHVLFFQIGCLKRVCLLVCLIVVVCSVGTFVDRYFHELLLMSLCLQFCFCWSCIDVLLNVMYAVAFVFMLFLLQCYCYVVVCDACCFHMCWCYCFRSLCNCEFYCIVCELCLSSIVTKIKQTKRCSCMRPLHSILPLVIAGTVKRLQLQYQYIYKPYHTFSEYVHLIERTCSTNISSQVYNLKLYISYIANIDVVYLLHLYRNIFNISKHSQTRRKMRKMRTCMWCSENIESWQFVVIKPYA